MLTSTSKTYIQKKSPETEWHQKWKKGRLNHLHVQFFSHLDPFPHPDPRPELH